MLWKREEIGLYLLHWGLPLVVDHDREYVHANALNCRLLKILAILETGEIHFVDCRSEKMFHTICRLNVTIYFRHYNFFGDSIQGAEMRRMDDE